MEYYQKQLMKDFLKLMKRSDGYIDEVMYALEVYDNDHMATVRDMCINHNLPKKVSTDSFISMQSIISCIDDRSNRLDLGTLTKRSGFKKNIIHLYLLLINDDIEDFMNYVKNKEEL